MKKKILIPISISFSIRYLIRTGFLEDLKNVGIPIVALSWKEPSLISELSELGIPVVFIPNNRLGNRYLSVRKKIDNWYKLYRLRSPSSKIREKCLDIQRSRKSRLIRYARKKYHELILIPRNKSKKLIKKEKLLLIKDSNYEVFQKLIDRIKPDIVFSVTPFHSQEDLLLRAAKNRGCLMLTSILSFDNVTKRGWLPFQYDGYMVWNEFNKRELLRAYPLIDEARIDIIGAPQFDFYWDQKRFIIPKQKWLHDNNLPSDKKIILYAGGPAILFPQEPQYLKDIAQAISDNIISNTVILFRRHPNDNLERWREVIDEFKRLIFLDIPWGKGKIAKYDNITEEDIRSLSSLLCHTDVHVNACSTMSLDGAIFDKFQIGPAYDANPGKRFDRCVKQLYQQEHFLPITLSGGLNIATSRQELINFIKLGLQDANCQHHERNEMLKSIITFPDGKATERLNASFRRFMKLKFD